MTFSKFRNKDDRGSSDNIHTIMLLGIIVMTAVACKVNAPSSETLANLPDCYILYDAGSSRTRLFVFEQTPRGWLVHTGPTTAALADPIRGNRGRTMADADSTIDAMIGALDDIRGDGPPNGNGQRGWSAFDWQRQCDIKGASAFGTAGMRIAEREDAVTSSLVWKKVRERLAETLGVPVGARTLSEFEEGLFAWLALSESQADVNFGVAEMGGASMQVTFPCRGCEGAKNVWVKGQSTEMYSRSFLGWGQDEAWKSFGRVAACKRGTGLIDPAWEFEDCEAVMTGFAAVASEVAGYIEAADSLRWYVSDAFRYMQASDIENYCIQGLDSGFESESSCFRAVYLQNVLNSLAVPLDAEKSAVNWTLGAMVCMATRCLESRPAN